MNIFKRLTCFKLIITVSFLSIFHGDAIAGDPPRLVFDTKGNILGSYIESTPTNNLSNAKQIRMKASVSGITQQAMIRRGYTTSDPRALSTISRMSTAGKAIAGTAGAAAAVTVGTVTAPAWGSFLLATAAAAAVGAVVSIAVGAAWNWLFGSDQMVTTQYVTNVYQAPAIKKGEPYWTCLHFIGATPEIIHTCLAYNKKTYPDTYVGHNYTDCKLTRGGTSYTCTVRNNAIQKGKNILWGSADAWRKTDSQFACSIGKAYNTKTKKCVDAAPPPVVVVPPVKTTFSDAVNAIPKEDLKKPVSPEVLAATANTLWKKAASEPGYDGIPFQQSNPITKNEVEQWLKQNPTWTPKVADFVAPNPSLKGKPSGTQWALPTPKSSPIQTGAPNQPESNLGKDPVIGAPTLEAPPTPEQIVNPITTALPEHKNFKVQGQTGQCPKPQFEFFGQQKMEAHCTLIESNKSALQVAMMFTWAVIALFIILSA